MLWSWLYALIYQLLYQLGWATPPIYDAIIVGYVPSHTCIAHQYPSQCAKIRLFLVLDTANCFFCSLSVCRQGRVSCHADAQCCRADDFRCCELKTKCSLTERSLLRYYLLSIVIDII